MTPTGLPNAALGLALGFATLLLLAGPPGLSGQQPSEPVPDTASASPEEGAALRLTVGDVGLGIGHVPRITGLRINWADRRLERVTGINLTLWRPAGRRTEGAVGGVVRGAALGLTPRAGRIQGLGVGLGGVVGEDALDGIHLAGAVPVSGGALRGLAVGGIAVIGGEELMGAHVSGLATVTGGAGLGVQAAGASVVAGERLAGLQLAGLAVVGGTHMRGVQVGGLATVAGEDLSGIQLGGLATVGGEELRGGQASGLAVVSGEDMRGIQAAGAAVVGGGVVRGLQIGGLAVVGADGLDGLQLGGLVVASGCRIRGLQASLGSVEIRPDLVEFRRAVPDVDALPPPGRSSEACPDPGITGITLAGVRIRTTRTDGISVAGGWIDADRVRGLSVAAVQRTGLQVGLAIGLVNWTDELQGVQLGLLNRAGNNPPPFRVLPLLNVHL